MDIVQLHSAAAGLESGTVSERQMKLHRGVPGQKIREKKSNHRDSLLKKLRTISNN